MATVAPAIHQPAPLRMPRAHTLRTLLVRTGRPGDLAATALLAKEAFTIEMLAVAAPTAAALRLVGSVPDARAGSTPAGSAT